MVHPFFSPLAMAGETEASVRRLCLSDSENEDAWEEEEEDGADDPSAGMEGPSQSAPCLFCDRLEF